MRKVRPILFLITVTVGVLLAGTIKEAEADKFPMPDIKGQFKKGNQSPPIVLEADQVTFNAQQEAVAQGHVYLDTAQEQVIAQQLTYNFNDHTGAFKDARVYAYPYQIQGQVITKVSDTHTIMDHGYMTSCDLDEPHFRMAARRMDVYQKDKAIVRGMKIYLGRFPVMYLPYYSQDLTNNRPIFTFEPGNKKEFGLFLLTTARFNIGSHVKLALHADVRERDGFGQGFDVNYGTPNFGNGFLTAYYTAENRIAGKHLWMQVKNGVRIGPTDHHTRFRFRWRHKWQIDKNTNAIWQIYKVHDYDILNGNGHGFIQNYFPRDSSQYADINTYFLLTHVMPTGTLTFNVVDSRINRPLRAIDRFPEITYTFNSQEIGQTGFYVRSVDTYSNLSLQNFPKTFNEKTERFDTNNDLSHPFKIKFLHFNPHVGGEHTYYSRTTDVTKSDIIRGDFRTSLDISTKFYKVWKGFDTNFAGMNLHGLRHVVTPTITYLYQAKPTFPPAQFNQFDPTIDDLYRVHQIAFGLENKLQTKRGGAPADLLRVLATSNFGLPTTTGRKGFNPVDSITDFYPNSWFSLHNENEYDFRFDHFNYENVNAGLHFKNWSFNVATLYTRTQSVQMVLGCEYHINPKWSVKVADGFPLTQPEAGAVYTQAQVNPLTNMTGVTESSAYLATAREFTLTITRDLHEWQMDFVVDSMEKHGVAIYLIFRLKIFPHMNMNLGGPFFPDSHPGANELPGANGTFVGT